MLDVVYKNYETFLVLGQEVNLISEETDSSRNTVAEVSGNYCYLGDEPVGPLAAIFAWQEIFGRDLTDDELERVLIENSIEFKQQNLTGESNVKKENS